MVQSLHCLSNNTIHFHSEGLLGGLQPTVPVLTDIFSKTNMVRKLMCSAGTGEIEGCFHFFSVKQEIPVGSVSQSQGLNFKVGGKEHKLYLTTCGLIKSPSKSNINWV